MTAPGPRDREEAWVDGNRTSPLLQPVGPTVSHVGGTLVRRETHSAGQEKRRAKVALHENDCRLEKYAQCYAVYPC